MKQFTLSLFDAREAAEEAINRLHSELDIKTEDISYIYQNTEGDVKETDASEITNKTPKEGAVDGAKVGGGIGAALGLATVVGMIPVIGPVFAAGPIVASLGLGAGAIGTTAAGAVTGAAAGGLVGALTAWGTDEAKAKHYEDRVMAGDVFLGVHTADPERVESILTECGAREVGTVGV